MLWQGAVVLAKDWQWAALTLLAVWLVTGSCHCGGAPTLVNARMIFTEDEDQELKGHADPLQDEELGGTPESMLAKEEEARIVDKILAPYDFAAPCDAELCDSARKSFLRLCHGMAHKLVKDHLPGWPWVPGAEQSQLKGAEGRSQTGGVSAALFQAWMGKVGSSEGAAAAQRAPAPAAADEAMGGR